MTGGDRLSAAPLRRLKDIASYWISRSSPFPIYHQEHVPSDDNQPFVSVVIPCFNHGHYLREAVDSILGQSFQSFEIIIVDDGSTAMETRAILESFTRPKTRLLRHQKNRGLPAARNTGISASRGKYICCLDADDRLHPSYLEKALLVMEANQGIDFVYSWTQVFGEEDRVWYAPQFDPAELIEHNQLNPPAIFRRTAWTTVGGFREEMTQGYEDWEFWIRLAYHGFRGYRIPEKLVYVRRVGRSFIHRAAERHQELVAEIHRYNPEIYQDQSWLKGVREGYREIYARKPFENLSQPGLYLKFPQTAQLTVWVLRKAQGMVIEEVYRRLEQDENPLIVVSRELLAESIQDRLRVITPYLYILPTILPRYCRDQWLKKVLIPTREVSKIFS